MLVKTLIIAVLLFIFYQDITYRAVYWILFPVLIGGLLIQSLEQIVFFEVLINSGLNLAFLFLQFFLLSAYFSLKARRWINITSGYLGWGDILFLLCVAFYFSPGNYLLFYITSLLIVLMATLIKLGFNRTKEYKIPLAGLQAVLFAGLLVIDWQLKGFNGAGDSWLLKYLNL